MSRTKEPSPCLPNQSIQNDINVAAAIDFVNSLDLDGYGYIKDACLSNLSLNEADREGVLTSYTVLVPKVAGSVTLFGTTNGRNYYTSTFSRASRTVEVNKNEYDGSTSHNIYRWFKGFLDLTMAFLDSTVQIPNTVMMAVFGDGIDIYRGDQIIQSVNITYDGRGFYAYGDSSHFPNLNGELVYLYYNESGYSKTFTEYKSVSAFLPDNVNRTQTLERGELLYQETAEYNNKNAILSSCNTLYNKGNAAALPMHWSITTASAKLLWE